MAPILKKEFLKLFSWKVIILEIYVIYFHESYYLGINVKYFPWKSLSWKLMWNWDDQSLMLNSICVVKSHAMSPQTEEMAPKYNPRKFSWILWQKLFCSFALSLLFSFRKFHFGTSWNEIFANKNEIILCTAFSIPKVSTFWDRLTFSLCSVIPTRENVTGHKKFWFGFDRRPADFYFQDVHFAYTSVPHALSSICILYLCVFVFWVYPPQCNRLCSQSEEFRPFREEDSSPPAATSTSQDNDGDDIIFKRGNVFTNGCSIVIGKDIILFLTESVTFVGVTLHHWCIWRRMMMMKIMI